MNNSRFEELEQIEKNNKKKYKSTNFIRSFNKNSVLNHSLSIFRGKSKNKNGPEIIGNNNIYINLAVTGGGMNLIPYLFAVPGASSTMIDARIPYDQTALCDTLSIKYDPSIKAVKENIAERGSSQLFMKGRKLIEERISNKDQLKKVLSEKKLLNKYNKLNKVIINDELLDSLNILGVFCTAEMTTDRVSRSPSWAFISIFSNNEANNFVLFLNKESNRTRSEEDELCSKAILYLITSYSNFIKKNKNNNNIKKFNQDYEVAPKIDSQIYSLINQYPNFLKDKNNSNNLVKTWRQFIKQDGLYSLNLKF